MEAPVNYVLSGYGVEASNFRCERIGAGHIHDTYKITGEQSFVLQKFNDKVFTRPDIVERNIQLTASYLAAHHPDYNFVAPIPTRQNRGLMFDHDGKPWRLFKYINNSYSIDEATSVDQAYKASAAFARLARMLRGCRVSDFAATIDRFHDLSFRYQQLEESLAIADPRRKIEAENEIGEAKKYSFLVNEFETVVSQGILRPGVFHNDTKINNVLFDRTTDEVSAVVDLDTLMPGYFIYDLGDLVRTIVSPAGEEEKDLNKVKVRREFYDAIISGYLSEMEGTLSREELTYVPFAGQMMTYIMAIRFLADFLRGDTYYHTTYAGQNLVRARNQLKLVSLLTEATQRRY